MTESGQKPWECVSHCGNYKLVIFFSQVNVFGLVKGIFFKEIISSKLVFHLKSEPYGKCSNVSVVLQNVLIVSMSYFSRSKILLLGSFYLLGFFPPVFVFNLLASKCKDKVISSGESCKAEMLKLLDNLQPHFL